MIEEIKEVIRIMKNIEKKEAGYTEVVERINELEKIDDEHISLKALLTACISAIHKQTGEKIKDITDELRENAELEAGRKEENEENESEEGFINSIVVRIDMGFGGSSGSR